MFIKTPEDDILKIKKLIPLILSVAILIGVTAVSSGKKVNSPSVSKTVSTTDETEYASKDEFYYLMKLHYSQTSNKMHPLLCAW